MAEAWERNARRQYESGWEQARFIATLSLQPYSRRPLKMTDVARFPWEKQANESAPASTRERMEEIAERVRKAQKKDQ